MAEPLAELESLANRVERARSVGSLDTERAVQLRVAEPLLETLGWDVRGSAVVPEATVGDRTFEYLLTVDGVPAVVVDTAEPDAALEDRSLPELERVVGEGRVPRAIAIDDRSVVLFVASDGEVHRRSFPLEELPAQASALGQYHRTVVEDAPESAGRRQVAAQRLAANREAVVDAVTAEILAVAGREIEETATEAAARAVDALIDEIGAKERAGGEFGPESSVEAAATAGGVPNDADQTADEPSATGMASAAQAGTPDASASGPAGSEGRGSASTDDSETAPSSSDGEYVVRFFGGSSSVGAVGTEAPRSTTVGVLQYLLENQDLATSVTLPWSDPTGATVLSTNPESDDWIPLERTDAEIVFLRPIDDPPEAKRAIESLAEAAGLRVMFQGDW